MLTRRSFHTRMLALLAASMGPFPGFASTPTGSADRVWLNRLTFGSTPEALRQLADLGREGWLEWQLALPADDPGLDARLGAARLRIASMLAQPQ
jgi:hypothetical protein